MLQKHDEVVRWQTARCEGLPLLPEVPAQEASPQCLTGMAKASVSSHGHSCSQKEAASRNLLTGVCCKEQGCFIIALVLLADSREPVISPLAEYVASDEYTGSHPRYMPQQGSCNPSAQIDSEVTKNDRSETEPGRQPATRLSKLWAAGKQIQRLLISHSLVSLGGPRSPSRVRGHRTSPFQCSGWSMWVAACSWGNPLGHEAGQCRKAGCILHPKSRGWFEKLSNVYYITASKPF